MYKRIRGLPSAAWALLVPLAAMVICIAGPFPQPASGNPQGAERLDAWRVIGPGGGGAQYNPSINPSDPNTVLVTCDMGGNYITHDGGKSWRMFNLRGHAAFFEFDASDPSVIYAGAAGALWRSEDSGRTWNLTYPQPASVRQISYGYDEASTLIQADYRFPMPVTAMAADPGNPKVLYAMLGQQVSRSTDLGKTWSPLAKIEKGAAIKLLVDPRSPPDNRSIYVICRDRVYALENRNWKKHEPPADPVWIYEATGGFSAGKALIYILIDQKFGKEAELAGGLLLSRDGGATWTQAHRPFFENLADKWVVPSLRGITAVFNQPEVLYASYSKLQTKGDPKSYFGVAKTEDAGSTWEYQWKNAATPLPTIHDVWLDTVFNPYWGENPLAIGVLPSNPKLLYETDYGRTMRSSDGGVTWEGLYSRRMEGGTFTTTGLDVTSTHGVFFDPFDARRVFISNTDISLFRSENGGASWSYSGTGIPKEWSNTMYWMTFDPKVKGRAWAVVSGTHDLPRTRILKKGTSAFKGGAVISSDGGRNWRTSSNGIPQAACTHIVLDPNSPPEARILYAACMGKGVFKSTDGGASWSQKSAGLPGPEPLAWRLELLRNGTLYLVLARRIEGDKYGTPDDGGLYQSTDGAATWRQVPLPAGLNGPTSIAADPENPSSLFLGAWCRTGITGKNSNGGIYHSKDAGVTWENVFDADQFIFDVSFDPANPGTLYAAGFQASIWRSPDRGASWHRIKGFNFQKAHRVFPDPVHPGMLYATTFGGGVWYGPAAGDPAAVEDIVTPVMAYSLRESGNHKGK